MQNPQDDSQYIIADDMEADATETDEAAADAEPPASDGESDLSSIDSGELDDADFGAGTPTKAENPPACLLPARRPPACPPPACPLPPARRLLLPAARCLLPA